MTSRYEQEEEPGINYRDTPEILLKRRRLRHSYPEHPRSSSLVNEQLEEVDEGSGSQHLGIRWDISSTAVKAVFVLTCTILLVIFLTFVLGDRFFGKQGESQTEVTAVETTEVSEPDATPETSKSATILVHVDGAVQQPQVIELPAGSHAIDAVELAGGLREDADLRTINLAQPLENGIKLYIPVAGEESESLNPPFSAHANPQSTQAPASSARINLNTASQEQLESLPRIGPKTAEKIILWRQTNGGFKSTDQLLEIQGIGQALFQALEPLVTV